MGIRLGWIRRNFCAYRIFRINIFDTNNLVLVG